MGPFDIKRQRSRRRAVAQLLTNPSLNSQARDIWLRIYNSITFDPTEYNRRVQAAYANHKQELIEWN